MPKRSRETSFSPSVEELSTPEREQDVTDTESERARKYKLVDSLKPAPQTDVMRCSLPPHKAALEFHSQEEYEVHYLKQHTNRCSSCGKNLPTAHFLALHIEENHNALRESLQAKGDKTYVCFVEDCDRKCSTPQKRRLHLIDKHGFPKFYNFRVVDTGIDKTTTLLREGQRRRVSLSEDASQSIGHRRRASSLAQSAAQLSNMPTVSEMSGVDSQAGDKNEPRFNNAVQLGATDGNKNPTSSPQDSLGDLVKSMSALRFVPTSVVLRKSKDS